MATAALYLALRSLRAGGFPDPARRAGHYRDGAKLWARTHAASAADVRQASSYGLGEQVKAALDAGCRHLIIGLGGSATNDGGIGFARRSAHDSGVRTAPCCRLPRQVRTAHIQRIDLSGLDPRLQQSEIQASCDVTNPLLGEHGATGCMARRKARTRRRSANWRREWRIIASCLRKPSDSTSADGPAPGPRAVWGLRLSPIPAPRCVRALTGAGAA